MIPPLPPEMNSISDEEIMVLEEEDVDEVIDMEDIEKVDSSEDENGTSSGHNISMQNDLPRDDSIRVYCPYKPEENVTSMYLLSI